MGGACCGTRDPIDSNMFHAFNDNPVNFRLPDRPLKQFKNDLLYRVDKLKLH